MGDEELKRRYPALAADGLACLDEQNARAYFLWVLALERYKLAVEGMK